MTQLPGQSRMPIPPGAIVVGGQWGSEGKGSFIYEIGKDYGTHVRTGGPQAGHSIKLPSGQVLKLQCIPVGAALGKETIIAQQSVVDPVVLAREVKWFEELGIPLDLTIDAAATILEPRHVVQEGPGSGGNMTARLGSTGKGVGAARAARIMREAETAGSYEDWPFYSDQVKVAPRTADLIRARLADPVHGVLVEAAQGIELSLFSSGYYPYVTSCEATPTGAFAEMGLPLRDAKRFESIGVFRTYPIRVAGNSGPLPGEVTWEAIEGRLGRPIPDSEKTTTVTNKIRRVAEWNGKLAGRAVERAGISWAALTFLDYVYPEIAGWVSWDRMPRGVKQYVAHREVDLGVPIRVVGTGFGTYAWRM